MLEKVLWRAMIGRRELLVVAKPSEASLRHHAAQTSYTEHQTYLGRPLSPSLTVYKQSIPAISSITNRVTGILLSLGFGAASFAACLGFDLPTLIHEMQDAIPGFTYVSKFAVAFPLTYHWLGGARHILWDRTPHLINLKFAPKSSNAIISLSAVVAAAATAYTIPAAAATGEPEREENRLQRD